jgi:hypothetical protein
MVSARTTQHDDTDPARPRLPPPIELVGVLIVAWACDPSRYFEACIKYLQLADKASRTVALLTERLDQHRGRGQQQITVKHVTVNADQAVVTDQLVSTEAKEAALLTSGTEKPMGNRDDR